jgi:putative hydrolase
MSSSPVSWDVAERVGVWVSSGRLKALGGAQEVVLDDRTRRAIDSDFARFTEQAERLVVKETGLEPLTGPPRGMVVDRGDWVKANLRSFRRLLTPLLDKFEVTPLSRSLSSVSGAVTGTQLGLVIGWMSTRVLGQYDILFGEETVHPDGDDSASTSDGGDVVSYVGTNIVGLERRHGFPPEQFRLWIALHEVTHRCQFTGVPWLHDYFLGLVEEGLSGMTPDPKRFAESARRAVDEIRSDRPRRRS